MTTVKGIWTIRERNRETGLVVAERTVHNILTNLGLTALAGASYGSYSPPIYLVIEDKKDQIVRQINVGDMVVNTAVRLDVANDTQLVLSVGQSNQEIVTYSSVTGTGPYVYNLTAPVTKTHLVGEYVCRNVAPTDDMTTVQNEQQYDSIGFPGIRAISPGGYSSGVGNWTMQFYISGNATVQNFVICGLADSMAIGSGNLHNHFVLGYFRNGATDDIEIDGSITISNGS